MESLIKKKNDYINHANMAEPKTGVLFVDFVSKIIVKKSRRMKNSYARNYRTLIFHLNNFCEEMDSVLFTNSINEDFLDDFIVYLESKMLKKTYIKALIESAKAMVRKAANYGYAVDYSYDDVVLDGEETPAIYFSMNDISRIYYYKGLTKKQEQIRDLFVVGCLTALRYSDLITLGKADFGDRFISKITKKTGVRVVIPIHDFVRDIYDKHNGEIPGKVSSQHFNRYIKLICKKIGINDKMYITYTRGGRIVTDVKEKWELVSTHTARRSGATNLFKTGRISVRDIMAITGHSTEKSFMRYVKVTKEDIANNIAGDNYFRK